jgi:hypothetical protein
VPLFRQNPAIETAFAFLPSREAGRTKTVCDASRTKTFCQRRAKTSRRGSLATVLPSQNGCALLPNLPWTRRFVPERKSRLGTQLLGSSSRQRHRFERPLQRERRRPCSTMGQSHTITMGESHVRLDRSRPERSTVSCVGLIIHSTADEFGNSPVVRDRETHINYRPGPHTYVVRSR